jgi:hypothetical protein
MKGFSVLDENSFEGLHWQQVIDLWSLLSETDIKTISYIEKKYKKSSSQFVKTLAFLTTLRILKYSSNKISVSKKVSNKKNLDFKFLMLNKLASSKNHYSKEIANYLNKYNLINGQLKYRPIEKDRSKESAVRNFLMEVGIVNYLQYDDNYVILPDYLFLYVKIRNNFQFCSPLRFKNIQKKRDEIGVMAERAALEYEIRRVGAQLSCFVEHLSLRNVSAGYDIISVEAGDGMDKTPRYIEVKAVSQKLFQFRWSHNEVAIAHLLGSLYFLYLVPIGQSGTINKSGIITISNPISEVFSNKNKWLVESDVFFCRPKTPILSSGIKD